MENIESKTDYKKNCDNTSERWKRAQRHHHDFSYEKRNLKCLVPRPTGRSSD